jgi:anti-sigma regulatory factor (Ser/Thr protein kinase)
MVDFARAAGIAAGELDDLRLAVSEALTNVVVHAYRGEPGEIILTAAVAGHELWVLIADDGVGMRPRVDGTGLGLGLGLIAQASDELTIAKRTSGGIELRMRFKLRAPQAAAERGSRGAAPARGSAVLSLCVTA